MIFSEKSTVLFIGDSITDCGRRRPVGENEGLGGGYVNIANAMIQAYYPQLCLKILNTGISGDTIRSLKARWQTDVFDLNPDYLFIMIGVNDVWRQFDNHDPKAAVKLDEYTETYKELITMTKGKVKKIILVSPFLIEKDKSEPMMATLIGYIDTVKKLAEENNFIYVPLQEIFDEYVKNGMEGKSISGDRVHPSQVGSMIIAKSILEKCGFDI